MKRFKTLTVILAVAVAVFAQSVYAQDVTETVVQVRAFVDADGDGICDNVANRPVGGRGLGRGVANFVDEDGDGICDNFANRTGKGLGKRLGNGRGQGGAAFVDADGDGVCDNYTAVVKSRAGRGRRGGSSTK